MNHSRAAQARTHTSTSFQELDECKKSDKAAKRSLKALYRGKNHMTRVPEPSAFMHEPTVDLSLQSRGEGMRATWSTMKWPEPAGGSTLKDSLASSGPRSARMRSVGR